MSIRRRVLLNIGSNWATLGVNSVVGLVVIPVILHRLGDEAYGVWALLAFGLSYPVIFERAFALSLTHFVAAHRDRPERVDAYLTAALGITAVLAAATVVLAAVCAPLLPRWLHSIPPRLAGEARATTLLVGTTLALNMLAAPFSGLLKGYNLFTHSNAVTVAANLLRAAGIVVLLSRRPTMIAVQTAYVGAAALLLAGMAATALRATGPRRLRSLRDGSGTLRNLWSYTAHSMIRSGSRVAMFNTLALLVGWRGTARDVTLYDLALKIPTFLNGLMAGAQNVFLPLLSERTGRGDRDGFRRIAVAGNRLHLALSLPVAGGLLVGAPWLLGAWLQRPPTDELVRLMRLLVLAMLPSAMFGVWLPALVALGRLRAVSVMAVAGTTGTVLLALGLFAARVRPPLAAALAMLSVQVLYRACWLPWYGLRSAGIPGGDYVRELIGLRRAGGRR